MYYVLNKTFEELKEFKSPKFPFNYRIIKNKTKQKNPVTLF